MVRNKSWEFQWQEVIELIDDIIEYEFEQTNSSQMYRETNDWFIDFDDIMIENCSRQQITHLMVDSFNFYRKNFSKTIKQVCYD